jgi:hypothetical protein
MLNDHCHRVSTQSQLINIIIIIITFRRPNFYRTAASPVRLHAERYSFAYLWLVERYLFRKHFQNTVKPACNGTWTQRKPAFSGKCLQSWGSGVPRMQSSGNYMKRNMPMKEKIQSLAVSLYGGFNVLWYLFLFLKLWSISEVESDPYIKYRLYWIGDY